MDELPNRSHRQPFLQAGTQGLATGTTVVNGTLEPILEMAGVKAVFYGISIARVAWMLGLERFCPRST